MSTYKKPFLSTYTSYDILGIMGPLQTAYVQFEIWRTSQLNQHQKQYQIAKVVERPSINANNKYYKIV